MRRSTAVTLTLLPVLATAAIARADDPPPPPPTVPEAMLAPDAWAPQDQTFMPPGMTPPVDCEDDDSSWNTRPECQPVTGYYLWDGRVIRGGFGHYFWTAGG